MGKTPSKDDQLSDEEAGPIRDAALLRALNTPPKPHSAMKLGKAKSKSAPVASPKKGGRPEKDDSKS
jgi:hypothetical protein